MNARTVAETLLHGAMLVAWQIDVEGCGALEAPRARGARCRHGALHRHDAKPLSGP